MLTRADRAVELASTIKAAGRRLGFLHVGVTDASALDEPRARLARWLTEGRHGHMRYLEEFQARHERFLAAIPNLRSLVIVAAGYEANISPRVRHQAAGRIARYAMGRDYHEVVRARLEELGAELQRLVEDPVTIRCCVDTTAVHERSLAASAGLGFIGKNTCLILPKGGSWIVLGVLATDLEIAPDRPLTHTCGACTRCLEACPTGALTEPYRMDARLCIAYLTLEHRGDIPPALQEHMGNWIAGCDICQEVCPYNAKPAEPSWLELTPSAGAGDSIPLEEILAYGDAEVFQRRFAKTALTRPTYQGMVRNAAIAAGNAGDPQLVQALRTRADDPDPVIQRAARTALNKLGALQEIGS